MICRRNRGKRYSTRCLRAVLWSKRWWWWEQTATKVWRHHCCGGSQRSRIDARARGVWRATLWVCFLEWRRFVADCCPGPFKVSVLSNHCRHMMTRIITAGVLQCLYLYILYTVHTTRWNRIYLLLLHRKWAQVVRHTYNTGHYNGVIEEVPCEVDFDYKMGT